MFIIQNKFSLATIIAVALLLTGTASLAANDAITLGPRPAFLIDQMRTSPLKEKLLACASSPVKRTLFSIGHRGASLMFPEHTEQSYRAAASMGAGIIECDVAFTADKELVCRHSHSDLQTTTNILLTPLADTCVKPFVAASATTKASAECRTNDITLAEFSSLKGKMDSANVAATTAADYMNGTAGWRTDLYATSAGKLMTHAESIELFKSLGVKFTPELKTPTVNMPMDGFSQQDFAQKMIDEYKAAGVPPADVWAQSFRLEDVLYWIKNEPEFGKQAVYLDGRYDIEGFDPMKPETFEPSMGELKNMGVNYIAPPIWVLITTADGKIIPSTYAKEAHAAGLKIISWSLERSGPMGSGGGWYYQSVNDEINSDGMIFEVLDVLAQGAKIDGMFSDWPATVSYYASCMGLK